MDDIEKIIIPIAVGLISWFIKSLFINLITKRKELVHREWEYRLKEIWSPLYYWSGVILFDSNNKNGVKHGLKELEEVLAKAAYLIPKDHYYSLIKIVEMSAQQKTKAIADNKYISMRKYIFNQIELLNYLLYRSSDFDDVSVKTNLIYPYKYLLRMITIGIIHALIWAAIALVITLLYWSYNHGIYWMLGFVAIGLMCLVYFDEKHRSIIREEIKKRL